MTMLGGGMEVIEKRKQHVEMTTLSERFSGFVAYHFILALLMDGLFWLIAVFGELFATLFYEIEDIFPWLLAAFTMGIYFPAGMVAAKRRNWTCQKDSREICLAILQPAAAAWGWAALVILGLCGPYMGFLLPVMFPISMFLASPSSIFVLCFFDFWMTVGSNLDVAIRLTPIGLLAGFFPPLLFALGSFWQSARMEKKALLIREGGAGGGAASAGLQGQQSQIIAQTGEEGGQEPDLLSGEPLG